RLAFMAASKIITQGSPREIKSQLVGQVIEIKAKKIQDAYWDLSNHMEHWRIAIFSGSMRVLLENAQDDLEGIKSLLQEFGCGIESIRPIPCSLEEAFIDI